MGAKNSCFVGQKASEMAYSDHTMNQFLAYKGWHKGSVNWPFHEVSEVRIIYLDDLAILTPKGVENAEQVHLNVLEYFMWSSAKLGFKIGKGKFKVFKNSFKVVGHFFSTETGSTGIPPEKICYVRHALRPRRSAGSER